jgi:predicted amidohydrolase YtcJ
MSDQTPAEYLFTNGPILTMAEPGRVEALLIRDDRIVAGGRTDDCTAAAVGVPKRVDLDGAALIPGFVDAHCHPLMYGQFQSWVDCSWGAAPGIDDVVGALLRHADHSGRPVRGQGFHHGNVAEHRMLSRHDLDRVATGRDVLVFHSSGHGAIANSHMLERCGITRDLDDPPGGHFGREADGATPNGEVWDAAADWLTGTDGVKITNHGPNFHIGDDPDVLVELLARSQGALQRAGVTTAVDCQVTSRELAAYFRLRERGGLQLRYELLVLSSLLPELESLGLGGRLGDDRLAIAGVKLYADGALTGQTARFSEPYCCDPTEHCHHEHGDRGYLYHKPGELADLVARADALGLQTGVHAQGDEGIQVVLDAHRLVRTRHARRNARHRIEHCGVPTAEQIAQVREYELWPVTQPQYIYRYGDQFVRALQQRAAGIMPLAEFRESGVPVVLSSDAPVCPPDPLEAIAAAVARTTISGTALASPLRGLTAEEAIAGHTRMAAASIKREHAVGSLAPGLFADLVVLSADPSRVLAAEIMDVEVLETWSGGKKVYDRATASR